MDSLPICAPEMSRNGAIRGAYSIRPSLTRLAPPAAKPAATLCAASVASVEATMRPLARKRNSLPPVAAFRPAATRPFTS